MPRTLPASVGLIDDEEEKKRTLPASTGLVDEPATTAASTSSPPSPRTLPASTGLVGAWKSLSDTLAAPAVEAAKTAGRIGTGAYEASLGDLGRGLEGLGVGKGMGPTPEETIDWGPRQPVDKWKAAAQTLSGAAMTGLAVMAPEAAMQVIANPVAVAADIAGGMAAGKLAKKGTELAGGGEGAREFAEVAGNVLVPGTGGIRRYLRGRPVQELPPEFRQRLRVFERVPGAAAEPPIDITPPAQLPGSQRLLSPPREFVGPPTPKSPEGRILRRIGAEQGRIGEPAPEGRPRISFRTAAPPPEPVVESVPGKPFSAPVQTLDDATAALKRLQAARPAAPPARQAQIDQQIADLEKWVHEQSPEPTLTPESQLTLPIAREENLQRPLAGESFAPPSPPPAPPRAKPPVATTTGAFPRASRPAPQLTPAPPAAFMPGATLAPTPPPTTPPTTPLFNLGESPALIASSTINIPAEPPRVPQTPAAVSIFTPPTTAADVSLTPETAAASYPAMKRVEGRVMKRRAEIEKIQSELHRLDQSGDPSGGGKREGLKKRLAKLGAQQLPDEDRFLRMVQDIEATVSPQLLQDYSVQAAKPKGGKGAFTNTGVPEAFRGPEYAPAFRPERGNPQDVLHPTQRSWMERAGVVPPTPPEPPVEPPVEPPTPGQSVIPEASSEPPITRPTGYGIYTPNEYLQRVGEIGADLYRKGARVKEAAEAKFAAQFHRLNVLGSRDMQTDVALNDNVRQQLEGLTEDSLNEKAARLAAEGHALARNVHDAITTGDFYSGPFMSKGENGEMYLFSGDPERFYPHQVLSPDRLAPGMPDRAKTIHGMVADKKVGSEEEAANLIDEYISWRERDQVPNRLIKWLSDDMGLEPAEIYDRLRALEKDPRPDTYGSLDYRRIVNLPFINYDVDSALSAYARHAWMRVERAKVFGQRDEALKEAIIKIRNSKIVDTSGKPLQGAGEKLAKDVEGAVFRMMNQYSRVDRGSELGKAVAATLTRGSGFFVGPTSAIPNLSQATMFGIIKADIPTVAAAVNEVVTHPRFWYERAHTSGARTDDMIRELYAEMGRKTGSHDLEKLDQFNEWLGNALTRWHEVNGFGSSEYMQRVLGQAIGEKFLPKVIDRVIANPHDKQAWKDIWDLTLEQPDEFSQRFEHYDPANPLAVFQPEELDAKLLLAGKRMSDYINTRPSGATTPMMLQGSIGRTAASLQRFAIAAAKMTWEETIGRIKRGDKAGGLKNFAVFLTLFPFVGSFTRYAQDQFLQGTALATGGEPDWEKGNKRFSDRMRIISKPLHGETPNLNDIGNWLQASFDVAFLGIASSLIYSSEYDNTLLGALSPAVTYPAEVGAATIREAWRPLSGKGPPQPGTWSKTVLSKAPQVGQLVYRAHKKSFDDLSDDVDAAFYSIFGLPNPHPKGGGGRGRGEGRGAGRSGR